MLNHQIHFGRKFYQDKQKGYWFSTDAPRIYAHRWVWMNIHGNIPKGYHIHHRNEDKSDNRIENLELIEKSRHSSHRMQDPERKRQAALTCEKIRPLTKEWHGSEEGIAWHRAHGILTWINKKPIKMACKQCGNEYITKTYHQGFCSNACKSKWRRASGVDDIDKICLRCGMNFKNNKYNKQKYCSHKCAIVKI